MHNRRPSITSQIENARTIGDRTPSSHFMMTIPEENLIPQTELRRRHTVGHSYVKERYKASEHISITIPEDNLGQQIQHLLPEMDGLRGSIYQRSSGSISLIIPDDNIRQRTWLRRHVANTKAIALRNIVSVAIPTALREFFRRCIFNRISEGGAALALGAGAGYLPCILEMAGLYRDRHNQTRWTIIGRSACILLPGIGVTALIAIGGMSSALAAALSSANFIYTPLRDVIQHYIRLEDNLEPDAYSNRMSSLFSAMAYGPNQLAVNLGMDLGSTGLGAWMDTTSANAVARSFVNFIGETVDETVSLASRSYWTGREGETNIRFSPPSEHSWSDVINRILGAHAGRSALFSTVFSSAFLTSTLSPNASILMESGVVGSAAGVAYLPFMFSCEDTAPHEVNAMEMGLIQRNSPASSTYSNNVRIINERKRTYTI